MNHSLPVLLASQWTVGEGCPLLGRFLTKEHIFAPLIYQLKIGSYAAAQRGSLHLILPSSGCFSDGTS